MSCAAYTHSSRSRHMKLGSTCRSYDTNISGADDCGSGFIYSGIERNNCSDDNLFTNGRQAKCWRTSYPTDQASLLKCCTGETAEKDCDKNYCVKNWGNCATIFRRHCSTNLDQPECYRLIDGPEATANSKQLYNEMAQIYCKADNLNKGVCRKWCKKNLGKCKDNLRAFCKTKVDDPTYASTCACHFPKAKYQAIATKIAAGWDVPDNYVDPTPECMFPACMSSDYKDNEQTCSDLSISNCYQNIDINLEDSSVSNLTVKQDVKGCKSAYSLNDDKTSGDSKNTSAKNTSADDIDDNVPSDGMDDTTKIILTIIVILLVSLGLYLVVADDDDDDDDQMMFMGDQYQSETYGSYY